MSADAVLLIDDDEELGQLLSDFLTQEGFALTVAHTAGQGLRQARSGSFALVLLDLMLPDRNGFDVLRELREEGVLPVIMLTAKGEDVDRIVGLELGADDYLPKPFNPRELSARIKAVLRRQARAAQPPGDPEPQDRIVRGDLVLDPVGYRAFLQGRELDLTVIEFSLLRELAQSAGQVLSRESLLNRVRGRDFEAFDRSIDVHISHLRQKLGDDPQQPRFIRTVRSVGYQFIGEES